MEVTEPFRIVCKRKPIFSYCSREEQRKKSQMYEGFNKIFDNAMSCAVCEGERKFIYRF